MGRSTRYLESSATPEEGSYKYRVAWDNKILYIGEQLGPGAEDISGYDNAWDFYLDCCESRYFMYRGVRLSGLMQMKMCAYGHQSKC